MVDRHVYAVVVVVEGIDGNNATVTIIKMVIIHRIESMAMTMTMAMAMTVLTATITAMTIRTYNKKKN